MIRTASYRLDPAPTAALCPQAPGRLRRDLLVAQRRADHVADGGDHLLVGEGLRAGQHGPLVYQLIGAQRAGADPGQIPFVDRRLRKRRVRAADNVTGTGLAGPLDEGVGGIPAGPQVTALGAKAGREDPLRTRPGPTLASSCRSREETGGMPAT
jgi:hypothetical protein